MNITQLRKIFIKHSFKLILIVVVVLLIYMCVQNTGLTRQPVEHFDNFVERLERPGRFTKTMYYRDAKSSKETLITFKGTHTSHSSTTLISYTINDKDKCPVLHRPTPMTSAFHLGVISHIKINQHIQIGLANIFEFVYSTDGRSFHTLIIHNRSHANQFTASPHKPTLNKLDKDRHYGFIDSKMSVVWKDNSHHIHWSPLDPWDTGKNKTNIPLPGRGALGPGMRTLQRVPSGNPRTVPFFAMDPGKHGRGCTGIYTSYIHKNKLVVKNLVKDDRWNYKDTALYKHIHTLDGYYKIIRMFFVKLPRSRDRLYVIALQLAEGKTCYDHVQESRGGLRTCSSAPGQLGITGEAFCRSNLGKTYCPKLCGLCPKTVSHKSKYTYDILYWTDSALKCDFKDTCPKDKNHGIHEFGTNTEIDITDYVYITRDTPPKLKITKIEQVCNNTTTDPKVKFNAGITDAMSPCMTMGNDNSYNNKKGTKGEENNKRAITWRDSFWKKPYPSRGNRSQNFI